MTKIRKKSINLTGLTCLMLFWLGCQATEQTSLPKEQVTAPIRVELGALTAAIAAGVTKINLTVTDGNDGIDFAPISSTLTIADPIPSQASFSVSVPVGSQRSFAVTANDSSDLTIGYKGVTTVDIDSSGGSFPVNLQYVNFAHDSTGDVSGSGFDITDVKLSTATNGTADTSDDVYLIALTMAQTIQPGSFVAFIEFDTDEAPTTGRTQTKIDALRGSVSSGFISGSEFYMVLQDIGSVSSAYSVSLFDGNDNSVDVPQTANFAATPQGPSIIHLSINASAFAALIDADQIGGVNVLVGAKSPSTSLSPPNFSGFTPSDVMLDLDTISTIHYDPTFDTSGL